MNTMMMALLQGRLWNAASALQHRLQTLASDSDQAGEAAIAGELSKVFEALDALQSGSYGFCSDCEQPLEPDQLLMQPHRLRCTACDSRSHQMHATFSALTTRRMPDDFFVDGLHELRG